MRGTRSRVCAAVLAALLLQACGFFPHRTAGNPAPIDLNRASLRAVERLPGITPSMAARIVAGRPYDDLNALVERGILTAREADRIADQVVVQGRNPQP
jgi:DNA uptake protein ComE-like DNA-binding protein